MANSGKPASGFWFDGIATVRIMVGILLIFHGWQVFESTDMSGLADLLFNLSVPYPEAMAYTGKLVELTGGVFLLLGLFTRLMAALLFTTFMFIAFGMGDGKIFTDNQLPFLYGMVTLQFVFAGPGRISIDHMLAAGRKEENGDARTSVARRFGRYVSKG